jgi:hypothetical protein
MNKLLVIIICTLALLSCHRTDDKEIQGFWIAKYITMYDRLMKEEFDFNIKRMVDSYPGVKNENINYPNYPNSLIYNEIENELYIKFDNGMVEKMNKIYYSDGRPVDFYFDTKMSLKISEGNGAMCNIKILITHKRIRSLYYKFNKQAAQQADAPEPATMASPASQTPHRPAR